MTTRRVGKGTASRRSSGRSRRVRWWRRVRHWWGFGGAGKAAAIQDKEAQVDFRLDFKLPSFGATRCRTWVGGGWGKASPSFFLESDPAGRWWGGQASPWWALPSFPICSCLQLTPIFVIDLAHNVHGKFSKRQILTSQLWPLHISCLSCTYSKVTSTSPPSSHTPPSLATASALIVAFFCRSLLFSPLSPFLLTTLPSPCHLPLLLHPGRLALSLLVPLLHLGTPLHLQSFRRQDWCLHPAWSSEGGWQRGGEEGRGGGGGCRGRRRADEKEKGEGGRFLLSSVMSG